MMNNEEPIYYTMGGLSPLKAFEKGLLTEEEFIGFVKGNIIKYVVRMGYKNEDIDSEVDKAIHYLKILRRHYNKTTNTEEWEDWFKENYNNWRNLTLR